MAFTVITAQARSMLIAAQVPDLQRFKLWPEVVMTANSINNLVPVIMIGAVLIKTYASVVAGVEGVWKRGAAI